MVPDEEDAADHAFEAIAAERVLNEAEILPFTEVERIGIEIATIDHSILMCRATSENLTDTIAEMTRRRAKLITRLERIREEH
jgi:hypothetical protein